MKTNSLKYIFQHKIWRFLPLFLQKGKYCFWKLVPRKGSAKLAKIPYSIVHKHPIKLKKGLINSVNNSLSLHDLTAYGNLDKFESYGLGLILHDSLYVVIDIDCCIVEDTILPEAQEIVNYFSGAYVEYSPSNTGLHIIYQGEWPGLSKGNHFLSKEVKSTIEVFTGKSNRYVTVTGRFFPNSTFSDNVWFAKDSLAVKFLHSKYFLQKVPEKNGNLDLSSQYTANKTAALNAQADTIIKEIQKSAKHNEYSNVKLGIKGPTASENDWHYCLFILKYLDANKYDTIELLKLILVKERYRRKLLREDYLYTTVRKAVQHVKNSQISNLNNAGYLETPITCDVSSLVRTCNLLHMFHLYKPQDNQSYVFNFGKLDNFVKITTFKSLNHHDLDFLMHILFQYKQKFPLGSHDYSTLCLNLDIPRLIKDLGKEDNGSSRERLISSLERMSNMIMSFRKKIDKKGSVHQGTTNFMSYEAFYNITSENKSKYKKINVFLNPLTLRILYEASYNYTLINMKDRLSLPSPALRYLYNYIYGKTIPGASHITKISISQLLNLSTPLTNKNTMRSRKHRLRKLLLQFKENKQIIRDLSVLYWDKSFTFLYVKRLKLVPVQELISE